MRMNKHYLILALLSAVELSQTHHGSVQFSWAELSTVEQNGKVELSRVLVTQNRLICIE